MIGDVPCPEVADDHGRRSGYLGLDFSSIGGLVILGVVYTIQERGRQGDPFEMAAVLLEELSA
jgi:hypothetical protein